MARTKSGEMKITSRAAAAAAHAAAGSKKVVTKKRIVSGTVTADADTKAAAKAPRVSKAPRLSSSAAAVTTKARKRRRWRSGTVALREIRKCQKDCGPLSAKTPLYALVRDIAADHHAGLRWTKEALSLMRIAAEDWTSEVFKGSMDLMVLCKKLELKPIHMKAYLNASLGRARASDYNKVLEANEADRKNAIADASADVMLPVEEAASEAEPTPTES